MGAEALTQLLTISLIISIIILFVLVVTFIALYIRKKSKEKSKKKEENIKFKKQETPSNFNTVQTKMYTTESVKKFLGFDEIKDNMILQKDGKRLLMVVQCQGINYDLMSSVERVGVEQGFIQFLNTLTKPIQIHVQTRKVNLEESVFNYNKRLKNIESNYKKISIQYEQAQKNSNISEQKFKDIKLEYIRQKNLYEYTKDIIANTEKMSLNKNILTKNYYIVISYYPENSEGLFKKEEILDMAFSELYTNAQSIIRTLSVCGVTGKVLDSVELADLLYIAYNRDSSEIYGVDKAIKSGYDALYTTAPDVIDKKIQELDKLIDSRAMELANDTINEVTLRNKREKELQQKEKELDESIKRMAKLIIAENKNYISKEIAEQAIEEIDNVKKEISKKSKKKGA